MKCQPRPDSIQLPPFSQIVASAEPELPTRAPSRAASVSSLLAIDIPPSQISRRTRRSSNLDFDEFRRKSRLIVVNPDPPSDGSSEGEPQARTAKRRRREISVISARGTTVTYERPVCPSWNEMSATLSKYEAAVSYPRYRSRCGICKDPIINLRPATSAESATLEEATSAGDTLAGTSLRCYGSSLGHPYCFPCISEYFKSKLSDAGARSVFPIRCPECPYIIVETLAKRILRREEFEGLWLWAKAIEEVQTFYCPNGDCNARIEQPDPSCARSLRRTVCPACQVAFCYRCQVKWHEGRSCVQFARASGAITLDKALEKLAKKEKWRRCPKCRIVVERSDGCRHIMCRCGHEFCYNCGREWRNGCGQIRSIVCFPTKPQAWPETRSRIVEMVRDWFSFGRRGRETGGT